MAAIATTRHPFYTENFADWCKWRLAYEGGRDFINQYLKPLSARETVAELSTRKETAYCPAFAKAAINEIKDAIHQRLVDVVRLQGSDNYQEAFKGLLGGVDLRGSPMNTFIGRDLLPELLVMKFVGVRIDNPADLGVTLRDKGKKHPFLTLYPAESILSWTTNENNQITSVLLEECVELANEYGLPYGTEQRYRLMKLLPNGTVEVKIFDKESKELTSNIVGINRVPFVLFQINESLMKDVADYQVALMNLESSDISYALKSNYPFYYEFYDEKADPTYEKPVAAQRGSGERASAAISRDRQIEVGLTQGRRFPKGTEPPGFINPDPDTLRVSMEKEQQIKEDIRLLVNLNLVQAGNNRQSADSKKEDQRGLDSSLSAIGLVLQLGETEIGEIWTLFDDKTATLPTIKYPLNYSLKSDKDRQEEATRLKDLQHVVPSNNYKKVIAKQIVDVTVGHKVSFEELQTIHEEIDKAKTLTSDPDQIIADLENGLVSAMTASEARGYDAAKEVPKAKKEHAERLALIAESQGGMENASAARGVDDVDGKTGSDEKIGKPKRGKADKVIPDKKE